MGWELVARRHAGDLAGALPLLGGVPGHIGIFLVVPVFVIGGAAAECERGGRGQQIDYFEGCFHGAEKRTVPFARDGM